MPETSKTVTACLLIIGNEILSGRTKDANLQFLALELNKLGIRLMEVRVIPDIEPIVVDTVNEVRARFDYVFTTGGIGPTHDDITADCIAKAFGVGISEHPEAVARMTRHYGDAALFTPARRRMARVPHGGILVDNPVSVAPGFQIENVITFAGIPSVMQAMFHAMKHRLAGGDPVCRARCAPTCPKASSPSRWARCRSASTISTSARTRRFAMAGPAFRWCCAARMMHGWPRPPPS